jgi:hypothetical protein
MLGTIVTGKKKEHNPHFMALSAYHIVRQIIMKPGKHTRNVTLTVNCIIVLTYL